MRLSDIAGRINNADYCDKLYRSAVCLSARHSLARMNPAKITK